MAFSFRTYSNSIAAAFNGLEVINNTTKLKVALMNTAYSAFVSEITNSNWDNISSYDITNYETPTNYTIGGKALTNVSVTEYSTLDGYDVVIDADMISFKGLISSGFQYAVLYYSNGAGSLSPLIAYMDFDRIISCSNQTFSIIWHTDGIVTVSQF